jgi:hypothetical protein
MASRALTLHEIDKISRDIEKYQEERRAELEDEAKRPRERMLSDGHGFGERA